MKNKKWDIIIGTHNRHKELTVCLKSFRKLKGNYNLIVIDSSDNVLSKKYQKLASRYFHDVQMKSLSKKRNYAIKKSSSDFIVFTDDDCIPDKNWLNNLIKEFDNDKVMCVTGRTVAYKGSKDTEYEKKYGFDKIGDKPKIIQKKIFYNLWRIGHGNNMAYRKIIFDKIGLFDEKLGVGSEGLAGEDTEMFYRIIKNNYYIKYTTDAIIYHDHLIKDSDLPKVAYRNGYAVNRMMIKNFGLIFIISYFMWLFNHMIKIFKGDFYIAKQGIRGLLGMKFKS